LWLESDINYAIFFLPVLQRMQCTQDSVCLSDYSDYTLVEFDRKQEGFSLLAYI